MRIKLNEHTASQLLALHKISNLDCNVTHFLNLIINEMHLKQFPQKEEKYANSEKQSLPILH
jgi:hypothetical protein